MDLLDSLYLIKYNVFFPLQMLNFYDSSKAMHMLLEYFGHVLHSIKKEYVGIVVKDIPLGINGYKCVNCGVSHSI